MNHNQEKESFSNKDRLAISNLSEPVVRMISGQLSEKLKKGEYQLIIGEDASGRIPALIFFQIAKRYAQDFEQETPKLIFLAGSRKHADKKEKQARTEKELKSKFSKMGKKVEDINRAIIVTEHVYSGHSPRAIIWALQNLEIGVDLATLSRDGAKPVSETIETLGVDNLYFGEQATSNWRAIFGNERLSGVYKQPENIYSQKSSQTNRELLTKSRELAKQVGNWVYGRLMAEENIYGS